VVLTVPFDDEQPVSLQGKQEEVDIALQKLRVFLQWKWYSNTGKSEAVLRSEFASKAAAVHGPQHKDHLNELLEQEKIQR